MEALSLQRHSRVIQLSLSGQLTWYAVGALIAFLLPYLFSSVLNLDNDPYYAIYFTGAVTFLALHSITTRLNVVGLFTRNWRWSLALGVVVAAFLVAGVIQREDSTPHPGGLYFAFTILWRGLLYGIVDALILTAFPVAVAYAVLGARVDNIGRRLGFASLALMLSLGITATYHLGYEQFRDDGVAGPETGNAIISLPAILTTNPLGAVIAHASMHVAADVHAYETDLYLPPQTFVKAESGTYLAEVQLTDADSGRRVRLALDGTLIVALPSNPSTGYGWVVAGELPNTLRQEGDPRYAPTGSTEPVVGAGGTEVFTFTAVGAGTARLELAYVRSSESGSFERTFPVEVVIR